MTSAPWRRIAAARASSASNRRRRRVDDLGENAHVVTRQIGRRAAAAEIGRQIVQFVRPALERHAEAAERRVEIGAAAAGQR